MIVIELFYVLHWVLKLLGFRLTYLLQLCFYVFLYFCIISVILPLFYFYDIFVISSIASLPTIGIFDC